MTERTVCVQNAACHVAKPAHWRLGYPFHEDKHVVRCDIGLNLLRNRGQNVTLEFWFEIIMRSIVRCGTQSSEEGVRYINLVVWLCIDRSERR